LRILDDARVILRLIEIGALTIVVLGHLIPPLKVS
jgi:hypothetical protein